MRPYHTGYQRTEGGSFGTSEFPIGVAGRSFGAAFGRIVTCEDASPIETPFDLLLRQANVEGIQRLGSLASG